MNAMMIVGIGLQLLTGSVGSPHAAPDPATSNDQLVLTGNRQLSDLTQQERLELIRLQRGLRSTEGASPSETRQECTDRLSSKAPSSLERALVDLKCSQRPAKPAE